MPPEVAEELNDHKCKQRGSSHVVEHYSVLPHLKKQSERLKTFIGWNVSFLDPKKLVEGGFYYTSREDVVKCAFCGVEMGCWKEGDDPVWEHQRLMGKKCLFLLGTEEGALDGEEEEEKMERSQDVCGPYELGFRPSSAVDILPKIPFNPESDDALRELEELVLCSINRPVTPHLATYNSRLQTFEKWPIPEVQSPETLAKAGFYYTSVDDNVLCFHCGGGMNRWEVGDDPWVDHAREFSRCGYITMQKGREFINEVLRRSARQSVNSVTVEEREEDERRCTDSTNKRKKEEKEPILPTVSTSEPEKESQSHSLVLVWKKLELRHICVVLKKGIEILRERLKWFFAWNVSFWDLKRLAKVSAKKKDNVKCDTELRPSGQRDGPDEEHRQAMERRRPLATGLGAGRGVELEEDKVRSQDVCGPHGLTIRPFSAPERLSKIPFNIESDDALRELEELVLCSINRPVTPHLATYNSRLQTFEKWPIPEIQSPETLAKAGFYYTSVDDNVLCFHCGGGMNRWEVGDDPWVDHAREFSRCGYITMQKGREFINEVLRRSARQSVNSVTVEEREEDERRCADSTNKRKKEEKEPIPPAVSTSEPEKGSQSSQSFISELLGVNPEFSQRRILNNVTPTCNVGIDRQLPKTYLHYQRLKIIGVSN